MERWKSLLRRSGKSRWSYTVLPCYRVSKSACACTSVRACDVSYCFLSGCLQHMEFFRYKSKLALVKNNSPVPTRRWIVLCFSQTSTLNNCLFYLEKFFSLHVCNRSKIINKLRLFGLFLELFYFTLLCGNWCFRSWSKTQYIMSRKHFYSIILVIQIVNNTL